MREISKEEIWNGKELLIKDLGNGWKNVDIATIFFMGKVDVATGICTDFKSSHLSQEVINVTYTTRMTILCLSYGTSIIPIDTVNLFSNLIHISNNGSLSSYLTLFYYVAVVVIYFGYLQFWFSRLGRIYIWHESSNMYICI